MKNYLASLCLGLLAAGLSACTHLPPPVAAGCQLTGYPIVVGAGELGTVSAESRSVPTLEQTLPGLLASATDRKDRGSNDRVLVISGGSQNGAFGAGFFRGLASVPDYRVVTAVSTGALQSTFIFLANRDVPKKKYPAYFHRDRLIGAPGDSYRTDLALAYAIEREDNLLKVRKLGYVGAAIDGSIATFDPLRADLYDLITPDTIRQIATERTVNHRSLLVGVANADDGVGYAIDLTRLAEDAVSKGSPSAAVPCYVDALIASSTVPPGVPPVSLAVNGKQHMFLDGGAKFGVFFQQIRHAVEVTPNVDLDMVVNGTLIGGAWLDKGKPVQKWSVINFGFRAVDLMENEVYRFSVNDVARWGASRGSVRLAFISNKGLTAVTDPPEDYQSRLDGRKCSDAMLADAAQKPQEFYPGYMRCLIDYGQARGEASQWNPLTAIDHQ